MLVKDYKYNLKHGFFWLIVEGENPDERLTIQCRLNTDQYGNCVKQITKGDCGHNWGICAGANYEAFEYFGENECMETLFQYASNLDIELI